ncbi:hypothetical protein C922_01455 [Plasmodium inui San Antonio 1]|uniref:Uncharacterized protein n=1 Tax=Plasmodium inui San Antonio 1 TaxID=1237626 RepID=W7A5K5_9APIC|nr:hypothetical protein C922_01455 [Plasmodium inui San Antonio 1]EUD68432.1 hypothetical protein C922_01455 [Plasmodium inui San Antonio 1]
MSEVKSYRFKKKPPDLISKFKVIKEDWYDFIKYMSDLRNMYKCPLQMNGHCKDIHGEDHIITVNKKAIYENIHDVMKIKEWNNDIEFDEHPICKDSSSDSCSHSEESGSVYNFNKYKIIHNNIYSNNANVKRQKINAKYRSLCVPREKPEVKEEKKKYSQEICYKRRTRKKNILNSSCDNGELNKKRNKLAENNPVVPNEQCDLYHKKILSRSLTEFSKNVLYQKSKNSAYMPYRAEYDYTYQWKEYDVSYDQNDCDIECNDFVDTNESRKYNRLRECKYKEKVDNRKKEKKKKRKYFNNDEFSRSNSLSNLSVKDNISASDVPKNKKNNIFVKKNNKYEVYSTPINNTHKNDSQKLSKRPKKNATSDEAIQNNPHFDGSYAYNFAYMDKNDRSGGSTPVEAAHGTIMNLEEEIRNYNFRPHN